MEPNVAMYAQQITLATALGLIVGLERLKAGKEAGIRTFSLTGMAGCLSQMTGQPYMGILALILCGVIVAVTNVAALNRGQGAELTTSVALVVTSFSGILVGQGLIFPPVAAIIVVMILLAWKDEMVDLSHHLTKEEVHAAIMLLLLGLVILPVLPIGPIDPWGLVDLRRVWVTVVLISGIGFVNYVLLRLFGARGVTYTGFLGGLVNSTATVAEMSNLIRRGGAEFTNFAFRGIMLAKTAMVIRNAVILGVLAPAALPMAILPIGLMLLVTVVFALGGMRAQVAHAPELQVSSPFSLKSALEFGMYFLVLTVIGGLSQALLGDLGFYAVSFFGGMVSSSSTAATAGTLFSQHAIGAGVAAQGVVLSCISSAVVLLPLIFRAAKGTVLWGRVVKATALVLGAALVGLVLNIWFLPDLMRMFT